MNIIVTGASQGIGHALVLALNQDTNHKIVAIARNEGKLMTLKEKATFPENIHCITFDLKNKDYIKFKKDVLNFLGSVDILVNNAGYLVHKKFADYSLADFENTYEVNVLAPIKLTQTFLEDFNKKSHIVNIGSVGGVQGSVKFGGLALYSSSKGALSVLTECMALELAEQEIAVNCLALGAVKTEMLAKAFPDYVPPTTAAEMAGFIANFACTGHHFFNGKVLPVSISTP